MKTCPQCHGDGSSFWFTKCQICKGEGAVEKPVEVAEEGEIEAKTKEGKHE